MDQANKDPLEGLRAMKRVEEQCGGTSGSHDEGLARGDKPLDKSRRLLPVTVLLQNVLLCLFL